MDDTIRIRRPGGTWVVRAGGAVLGESRAALEMTEGDGDPVIFFPKADIAMAFLDRTGPGAAHPSLGAATRYAIVTKSTTLPDAAWSYDDAADLAGHVAFRPSDTVTVEEL